MILNDLRAHLEETRALGRDSQGREVLVGLSHEETEELLRLKEDRPEDNTPERHSVSLDREVELDEKHEITRRQIVAAEIQSLDVRTRH